MDGEVGRYDCELSRPYVSATAEHAWRSGLIVRLDADTGARGLGEASPLSNRTENEHHASRVLVSGLQKLKQREPDVAAGLDQLDALLPGTRRARTARFALSLALIDLLGQDRDEPLATLLATEHLEGRAPASQVAVNATIPDGTPEEAAEQAQQAAAAGFTTLKLKGGRDDQRDLERVAAARKAAGQGVRLRIDINGAWPDLPTARERLEALAAYELEYVEQPLPPRELEAMAALRALDIAPVAADEPVLTPATAQAVVEAEAADVLVVKPMVVGGPDKALEIARIAEAHDVPVVVTSTIDSAIARAGALHTAAALGPLEHACGLATGHLLLDEPASFDERIEGGAMSVPTAPGHGAWLTRPLVQDVPGWPTR